MKSTNSSPEWQLTSLLVEETERALLKLQPDGSMPAGNNGAYGHPETPVRNTSHWLFAFSRAWLSTGDDRFRSAADAAANYLVRLVKDAPGCVICRTAPGKDSSNGVLGQAHLIEALHEYWRVFLEAGALQAALALARRHPFDEKNFVWHRIGVDGKSLSPDFTFNHELYFAAALAPLRGQDDDLARDFNRFLAGLRQTLRVRQDGRVRHEMIDHSSLLTKVKGAARDRRRREAIAPKELHYHGYNLYIFGILHEAGVRMADYAPSIWPRIMDFARRVRSDDILDWATSLPSGAETAGCDYALHAQATGAQKAANLKLALTFLRRTQGASLNYPTSPDPATQAARSYRYWRLLPRA